MTQVEAHMATSGLCNVATTDHGRQGRLLMHRQQEVESALCKGHAWMMLINNRYH